MLRIFLLCCLLFSTTFLSFSENLSVLEQDTLACRAHRLKTSQVVIPAVLVGASSVFAFKNEMGEERTLLQRHLSTDACHHTLWDNYLQYAPILSAYTLSIFKNGKHNLRDKTYALGLSCVFMAAMVNAMKYTVREKRPDGSSQNSFPSGHTATAFVGAEFLFQEYYDTDPTLAAIGYVVAAGVGCMRIYNNRHYLNDVIAGASIGILSTKLAYYFYPKIFRHSACSHSTPKVYGYPLVETSDRSMGLGVNVVYTF